MAEMKIEQIFFDATKLIFPKLKKSDPRYVKVAEYARKHYFNSSKNRICVLCAIPGYSNCFWDFFCFCQRNKLNPGNREVIISDMSLFFTENYHKTPERVS